MDLAPIVLFVYNRPFHTQQVLNSLAANKESEHSVLYIYCDGAKEDATKETIKKIKETRSVINGEHRFKKVIIKEQAHNKGLANSIIDGVTEVINKHESVIVLEDDLILSPFFLFYMNDSLRRYAHNKKVGQIGACNFFACGTKYPSTFFIPMPDCLGWATWKERWNSFNADAVTLFNELKEKNLIDKFNAYGSYDMLGMLKMQIENKVDSWAIRWQAVCVLNNWYVIYPNPSFSNHIQSDEATHANINISPPLCVDIPVFTTREVEEIPKVIRAMKLGYEGIGTYYGTVKKEARVQFFKKAVYSYFVKHILHRDAC